MGGEAESEEEGVSGWWCWRGGGVCCVSLEGVGLGNGEALGGLGGGEAAFAFSALACALSGCGSGVVVAAGGHIPGSINEEEKEKKEEEEGM